jgi:iron complex outermembrane receptor protein
MNAQHHRRLLPFAIGAALTLSSAGVLAQPQIEEIMVTAQKREQSLQDVPVAVSAFTGNFIAETRIGDIRGLVDLTPGFNGRTEDSFIDALSIRGIVTNDFGIGGDPSIPIFFDGVWQGRSGGVQMNFYDIERVEVVKGPQATLFGRNAIAGAVSISSNKPVDEFEGEITAGIGNYGHYDLHGMVNIPLSDAWAYRGNVYANLDDGWLENLAGGDDLGYHKQYSTRHQLKYSGEDVQGLIELVYEDRQQDSSVYWDPQLGLDKDEVNTDLGDKGYDRSEILNINAILDWDISENYSFHSITGYKTYKFEYLEDYDARPERINHYGQNNDIDYYSQEFRLNFNGDAVSWFVGAGAYNEVIDGKFVYDYNENDLCNALGRTDAGDFAGPVTGGCADPNFELYWFGDEDGDGIADGSFDPASILGRTSEPSYNDMESTGYSVFGDVTWSVTDQLDVTLGARYTYDEKDMRTRVGKNPGALGNNFNWGFHTRGFVGDKENWSEITPRLALNYTLNEEISFYGNVSSGYKSGGYGTFGISTPSVTPSGQASPDSKPISFDPETSISYEVGMKSRLLDDTLQLNLAYFFYIYEDLQLLYFDQGSSQVQNLGEAENQGLEIDAHWLIGENWDLFFAGALMDSEITDAEDLVSLGVCGSDCGGNRLPFAPDASASLHLKWYTQMAGGELYAKAEYHWQDRMYSDLDNISTIAVDAWDEWNLRAGYETDTWSVNAYVQNVFDEEHFERGWANADPAGEYGYGITNTLVWPAKPRSFGVSATMKF